MQAAAEARALHPLHDAAAGQAERRRGGPRCRGRHLAVLTLNPESMQAPRARNPLCFRYYQARLWGPTIQTFDDPVTPLLAYRFGWNLKSSGALNLAVKKSVVAR